MTNKIPALSKGFYTTESAGGRGCIKIAFESLDELHAADDELRALLSYPASTEAQLIAAGFGYPMSKEDAVKAYKASLQPRTDHPSNADCEWCHGAGHDYQGDPCVGCCKPAPVAVVLPSPTELRALVTEAARDSDLIAGANYYTAAELAANYMLSKIKELNQ
ncbi:MAG: hypothetical protein IV106_29105 [Pseudomonas umsongensis]|nr:hypothetical protein [Pseudomonas umsongensis]